MGVLSFNCIYSAASTQLSVMHHVSARLIGFLVLLQLASFHSNSFWWAARPLCSNVHPVSFCQTCYSRPCKHILSTVMKLSEFKTSNCSRHSLENFMYSVNFLNQLCHFMATETNLQKDNKTGSTVIGQKTL